MNTENVRINITLPKSLIQQIDNLSGPRKRSRFIAEAVLLKINQKKQKELEKKLIEGYRACHSESVDLAKEFEMADLEDWNDND